MKSEITISVDKKERKRNAPLPYTTSSMQMDAANKINFRTRKTMMVAQQLYEGINIGELGVLLLKFIMHNSKFIIMITDIKCGLSLQIT